MYTYTFAYVCTYILWSEATEENKERHIKQKFQVTINSLSGDRCSLSATDSENSSFEKSL